jgi:hypothetical protein
MVELDQAHGARYGEPWSSASTNRSLCMLQLPSTYFLPFSLDINATIAEFDLKTWGFLVYPDDYDEQANPLELLMKRVPQEGIIPLATFYFQSFYVTPDPKQQVYCHRYREFCEGAVEGVCWFLALDRRPYRNSNPGIAGGSAVLPAKMNPNAWEVKSLSTLVDFPSFGPFEQGYGGPSADFFEKLNRICYMSMIRSDGVYSPPDSQESSLSDLSGPTMDGSSIASVADRVARARVDDDSVEMDTGTTSVHVDSDGTVTSVCLGPDGTINSIRNIFSSYTDCQPVLSKNHF